MTEQKIYEKDGRMFLKIGDHETIIQPNIAKAIRENPDKLPKKYTVELDQSDKLAGLKEQLSMNADTLRQEIEKSLNSTEPLSKPRTDALIDQAARAEQVKMQLDDIERASRTTSKQNVEQSFIEKLTKDAERLDKFFKGEVKEAPYIDPTIIVAWTKLRDGKTITDDERRTINNAARAYAKSRRKVVTSG